VYNAGQACNSNKRIIVMDDLFDEFVATLVRRATDRDMASFLSPSCARQRRHSPRRSTTPSAGVRLSMLEVFCSRGPGAYYTPTVLSGATKEMGA
jgi:succinate-semialdehyde dehydrogenase / glutarate-semialdehyde dehydrogenase